MADEGSADTFEYPINGRVLTLRKISRAQLEMLRRYIDGLQAKAVTALEAEDVPTILTVRKKISDATWMAVESQFLISDDLEWIQLEVLAGRITEEQLLPLLSNGHKSAQPADDTDPVPVKPGRKAPAKKAATPRAKR